MSLAAPEDVRIGSRDEQRFAVGAVVEAWGRPGRHLVQVVDLSLTGARVRCWNHGLREGDWLQLDLSLAPQRACIVWAQGSQAGCQFLAPLEPLDLKIILKALTPKPEPLEPLLENVDFAQVARPVAHAGIGTAGIDPDTGSASAFEMARKMGLGQRTC